MSLCTRRAMLQSFYEAPFVFFCLRSIWRYICWSICWCICLTLLLFIRALERSGLRPFHMSIIISHVTYLLSHAYNISHVNRYHMPTFYHMLLYLLRL